MRNLYQLQGDFGGLRRDPQYNKGVQHSLEVMAIMDLPFIVIGRPGPSLGIWKRFRATQDIWQQGRLKGVETISGIPRSLLNVFATVFGQANQNSNGGVEISLWMWPGELGDFRQCQLWEAWRLAAALNMRRWRAFPYPSRSDPPVASVSTQTSSARDVILLRLLSCLNSLAQDGPDANEDPLAVSSLLYPLVAAGWRSQF